MPLANREYLKPVKNGCPVNQKLEVYARAIANALNRLTRSARTGSDELIAQANSRPAQLSLMYPDQWIPHLLKNECQNLIDECRSSHPDRLSIVRLALICASSPSSERLVIQDHSIPDSVRSTILGVMDVARRVKIDSLLNVDNVAARSR
jgi:hypothetical protein